MSESIKRSFQLQCLLNFKISFFFIERNVMNYIEFNDDTYAYNPIRYLPMNEVEFKHSFRVAIENKGISKIITIGQLVYGFILGGVLYMSLMKVMR